VLLTLSRNVGSSSAVTVELQGLFIIRGLSQLGATPLMAKVFASTHHVPTCHLILISNLIGLGVLWSIAGELQ